MITPRVVDTIVIGAGPAGSTTAALLAEQGFRVLALEREKFPRYHIGESLLPFTSYPLKRLGLLERMRNSGFVKKYSVQFISASGKASQPFYFSTRYAPDVAQTWQVLRSEFDLMLLENARAKGAEVLEETTVEELIQEDGRTVGVRARTKSGQRLEGLPRGKGNAHLGHGHPGRRPTPRPQIGVPMPAWSAASGKLVGCGAKSFRSTCKVRPVRLERSRSINGAQRPLHRRSRLEPSPSASLRSGTLAAPSSPGGLGYTASIIHGQPGSDCIPTSAISGARVAPSTGKACGASPSISLALVFARFRTGHSPPELNQRKRRDA
ncbi:MAG: tryptophan 7-halogenase [Syntrophorhabdales bacterium]